MSDTHSSAVARVLLLNDDDTTMEFVVHVLERVFGKTHEEALKLVLEIHRDGSGECGVYMIEQASNIVAREGPPWVRSGPSVFTGATQFSASLPPTVKIRR